MSIKNRISKSFLPPVNTDYFTAENAENAEKILLQWRRSGSFSPRPLRSLAKQAVSFEAAGILKKGV